MCDECGNKIADDVKRALYYGLLKQLMKWKPISKAIEGAEQIPEAVVGIKPEKPATDRKYTAMKIGLYGVSSYVYENYLYVPGVSKDTIMGMCPCELWRDVYLLVIQQIYDIAMVGFNLNNLLTDTIAIFGSSRIDQMIGMIPAAGNPY